MDRIPQKKILKVNLLWQIAKYHEDLSIFKSAFARVAGLVKAGKRESACEVFSVFTKQNIHEHFDFEESNVFPLLDAYSEVENYLKEFIETHKIVHSILKSIEENLNLCQNDEGSAHNEIIKKTAELFVLLESHAKKELETIVPIFSKYHISPFLLGRSVVHTKIEQKNKLLLKKLKKESNPPINDGRKVPEEKPFIELPDPALPKMQRKGKNHVSSSEGYEVSLVNETTVRYYEKNKSIVIPIRTMIDGQRAVDEDDINFWEPPFEKQRLSEIDRIIVAARVTSCLKTYL
jgi:hemerythrin-like domain-containing protein